MAPSSAKETVATAAEIPLGRFYDVGGRRLCCIDRAAGAHRSSSSRVQARSVWIT